MGGRAEQAAGSPRSQGARAQDTLSWAKREVLDLLDALVNASDDGDFESVQRTLATLNTRAADPGRRLALLLQMSVACAGIVDIAEMRQGIDRGTLALDLAPALRSCLHQPGVSAEPTARCH
jgi:hypothetical protein